MLIQFRTQGTGSYTTLADDTAGTLISGFIPAMEGIAQVTPLFRAPNALVLARNNRVWRIKGTVETDHLSAAGAVEFIQTQPAIMPDYLDLQITETPVVILFTPTVLVGFEPLLVGQSSRITYSFVAANLQLISAP